MASREGAGSSGGSSGSHRKRWTERREVREPTLYDEWKKEERERHRSTIAPSPGSTIRVLTPERAHNDIDIETDTDDDDIINNNGRKAHGADEEESEPRRNRSLPLRQSSRASVGQLERPTAFSPTSKFSANPDTASSSSTTTTPTSRALDSPLNQSPTSPKAKKLVKDRSQRPKSIASPASLHSRSSVSEVLRSISKSNGHVSSSGQQAKESQSKASRTRAKTYEEPREEQRQSVASLHAHNRHRTGSMNLPLAGRSSGADYLASVPAQTLPPSAPSIRSIGTASQHPPSSAGRRSVSPTDSSNVAGSGESSQSRASAKRILHLMRTLRGRYSGNVLFRGNSTIPWVSIYCSIQEQSGDLVYEPRNGDGAPRTLVSGLKGCSVRPEVDEETPILEVSFPHLDTEIHLKLLTQVDYDSWYAALLWWQAMGPRPSSADAAERPMSSNSLSDPSAAPQPPPRTSSRKYRARKDSAKGERRKSGFNPKEAPVIKIGKMIYWDTSSHSSSSNSSTVRGRSATVRPAAQRTQSTGSRQWRRINGQLRENGELKLSAESDNSLISVVQLSQLSRCAIQRLDSSVMDDEHCIAVYPQYTSAPSENQPGFVRPIFLSLETRVLYEVWFVLLRAFTIPQLYGPRAQEEDGTNGGEAEKGEGSADVLATKTTDMFRMERSVSIRIIEAKMYPPSLNPFPSEQSVQSKGSHMSNAKVEQHGYYAEVRLDNETRGKTTVKFDSPNALWVWGETFDFLDLPPVLSSASVVVKRRSPDAHAREQHDGKLPHDTHASASESSIGSSRIAFDVVCGKVEIYLQELEGEKELEKWWPVLNSYNHRVGELLLRARAEERVILMSRDYEPLKEVLHSFSNGITLQIAQLVSGELKKVSDCLLDIFQVSGRVSEWLMALVEEEIDGTHKETPMSKLRFDRRVGSDPSADVAGTGSPGINRELIVRDMNKTATLEANLLFRGNTLLTKSLDTHMRRVGKEYLEASLGAKLREINAKDPDCEVDPSRLNSPAHELDRNWRRLLIYTQEVWKAIVAAKKECPMELRLIFRHIRACAEDRYGDFLRAISYSSVSGFLFLRFFCPAVLNPKLFGLLREDVKPRSRRTFTLIAKSLQTLSNMASFGSKEKWMEPMNAFLTQHRNGFKTLIDDVCYVPSPLTAATASQAKQSSPTYAADMVSSQANLSYTTPTTIMERLPPTSREGFPSLPFLIDQPRAYAELVQLWLEATHADAMGGEVAAPSRSQAEIMATIQTAGPDLVVFHDVCMALSRRTQDCLSRAERAERPDSASSFRWDELIDQLQTDSSANADDLTRGSVGEPLVQHTGDDDPARQLPPRPAALRRHTREWDVLSGGGSHGPSSTMTRSLAADRPASSGAMSGLHEGLRRAQLQSQGSDSAGASASNLSSAPSSDTEHTTGTTALPSYEKEIRHRERREAAKQQIKDQVAAAARTREPDKDKRKMRTPIVSALRKKNQRESKGGAAPPARPPASTAATEGTYTNYGI